MAGRALSPAKALIGREPEVREHNKLNIAVVGSGIAGNVAAYELAKQHNVTIFEKNHRAGGHTDTHTVEVEGTQYAIDTGFIVFNDRTYPLFNKLLAELGVARRTTEMSFSVRSDAIDFEYNGSSLNGLFAQRLNLFRPKFYSLIAEILRFNKQATTVLEQGQETTLGEFLIRGRYSEEFIHHYLIPMGAAIWSTDPAQMMQFPARFFVQFFSNHGLLDLHNRPTWYVVEGGSSQYLKPLLDACESTLRVKAPVQSVRRAKQGVLLKVHGEGEQHFDAVFLAAHSDQALRMLQDPTTLENQTLSAIRYQSNEVVLHTDERMLPKRRRAWAAWNYHLATKGDPVALTYNMNILQGIQSPTQFCVTLNHSEQIAPQSILKRLTYEHPVFTPAAVAAQQAHRAINGEAGRYYCGAYWRNGFHEDGVASALTAVRHFAADLASEQGRLSLQASWKVAHA